MSLALLVSLLLPAYMSPATYTSHARVAQAASSALVDGLPFSSEEGHFSLTFPGGFAEPAAQTTPIETKQGTFDMKVFTATKGATEVFMVAYVDYNDEIFAQGVETMLDGARTGAMKNLHGHVDKEKHVTLSGHPGRSLLFSGMTGGQKVYGRIDYYLAQPRLYQILYLATKKSAVSSFDITGAFKSFAITQ